MDAKIPYGIPEGITKYSYSTGTLEEIKKGKISRIQIGMETPNYSEVLFRKEGQILIPRVAGVYQERELTIETAQEREERKYVEAKMRELDNKMLSKMKGITDKIHPNLIHIGYDPHIWTRKNLEMVLNDTLNRIALSPVISMPNFFEKDIAAFDEIYDEEIRVVGEDPSKVSEEEYKKMAEKLTPKIEKLFEQLKQFGLTREEWCYILCFLH